MKRVFVCWCVAVKNKERRQNVESSRLRLSLPLFPQQCVSLCLCRHMQYMCECVLLCRHAESSCPVMNVHSVSQRDVQSWTHQHDTRQQLHHVVWRQFNNSRTLLTLPQKSPRVWLLNPFLTLSWSTSRKYQQCKVFLMLNNVMWLSSTAAQCPK